jgi:hypothetical protein
MPFPVLPVGLADRVRPDDHRLMRLIIEYPDGSLRPAMIMAMMGDRMRASLPGCEDAVEFRLADGRWLAENGDVVRPYFKVSDSQFQAVVQHTAEACDDRADALEVHLWSICVPQPHSSTPIS